MPQGGTQFVGAAGQYYVAYGLAVRHMTVGLPVGNAPAVDLLACSHDGRRTLALQVKTLRNAYHRSVYGSEGYEWIVGRSVIGRRSDCLWYAFVDLQEEDREGRTLWSPRIFFVPSHWVAESVEPHWSEQVYFLPVELRLLTEERWDLVQRYLSDEAGATAWAKGWPEGVEPPRHPQSLVEATTWQRELAAAWAKKLAQGAQAAPAGGNS